MGRLKGCPITHGDYRSTIALPTSYREWMKSIYSDWHMNILFDWRSRWLTELQANGSGSEVVGRRLVALSQIWKHLKSYVHAMLQFLGLKYKDGFLWHSPLSLCIRNLCYYKDRHHATVFRDRVTPHRGSAVLDWRSHRGLGVIVVLLPTTLWISDMGAWEWADCLYKAWEMGRWVG